MPITQQLMTFLADGRFQSGQVLAEQMGVSRASIWNGIKQLRSMGMEVFSVRGKGYRLGQPVEMLDRQKIMGAQLDNLAEFLPQLYLFWQLESTNAYLMGLSGSQSAVCLAELQTGGRGRRGRQWLSPPGGNIYYSHMWEFACGPENLSGLSLAAAAVLVNVLTEYGVAGLNLKWPNDVLYQNKKLAGILLELTGEATGPCKVVVGMGVNVHISTETGQVIDQPWIDLNHIVASPVGRNQIIVMLITQMTEMFRLYEKEGIQSFLPRWRELDAFYGVPVQVKIGDTCHDGVSGGVDEKGNLVLVQGDSKRHFASGEVSLRSLESTACGSGVD